MTNNSFLYRYAFIIIFVIMAILMFFNTFNNFNPPIMNDEVRYSIIVKDWKANGTAGLVAQNDNKPITFLWLQRMLKADETIFYTRTLNFILIIAIIILVYSLTGKPETCLFFIIPWFLNSMWLTVEIVELFLILLGFKFIKYQGLFIGLATIFRPYAILYGFLLKRNQIFYVIAIGGLYLVVTAYLGILGQYGNRIYSYAVLEGHLNIVDVVPLMIYPLFLFIGSQSGLLKWGLVASIPLLIRTYAHYYLVPFGLFFVSYLCASSSRSNDFINPCQCNNKTNNPQNRRDEFDE